jgi:hypothetical protein
MKLTEMTPLELIQILRDAVETRNGKMIQAVKDEYNRRSKYDE